MEAPSLFREAVLGLVYSNLFSSEVPFAFHNE